MKRITFSGKCKTNSSHKTLYDLDTNLEDNFYYRALEPKGDISTLPRKFEGPLEVKIYDSILEKTWTYFLYRDLNSNRLFVERYAKDKAKYNISEDVPLIQYVS